MLGSGLLGGPVSTLLYLNHDSAISALDELDSLLKTNSSDDLVQYAIATPRIFVQ